MKTSSIITFTRNGMGEGPQELQQILAGKFLTLTLDTGQIPSKIIFYTEGVKLACTGSPILEILQKYEEKGVELVLCKTCLDFFKLTDQVKAGIVGGMGDIIDAIQKADKVISL